MMNKLVSKQYAMALIIIGGVAIFSAVALSLYTLLSIYGHIDCLNSVTFACNLHKEIILVNVSRLIGISGVLMLIVGIVLLVRATAQQKKQQNQQSN